MVWLVDVYILCEYEFGELTIEMHMDGECPVLLGAKNLSCGIIFSICVKVQSSKVHKWWNWYGLSLFLYCTGGNGFRMTPISYFVFQYHIPLNNGKNLKCGETILNAFIANLTLTRKIQSHLNAWGRYPRVESLKLQIQIFPLETSKQTKCKQKDKKT